MATTRRALLRWAGVAAGTAVLGACTERSPSRRTHAIIVTVARGASVVDQDGQVVTPPLPVAAATPGWEQVVTARPDGPGTRIMVQDLAAGRTVAATTLAGNLEPRIVSPDGRYVASVTPGGAGIHGLHDPAGRDRTTIVVSGPDGERSRWDVPGNIEPEVFSPGADRLYVVEYIPAGRPERLRGRAVDLATGRLAPLPPRSRPAVSGPDEVRAHRVDRVHDARRNMLFSLYAHEEDAAAFVQCLHLVEGWVEYVPLPAPFGRERPGVHAIAQSAGGERLCVVHAPSASVADIDADRLTVTRVGPLPGAGAAGGSDPASAPRGGAPILAGKPNVRILASGDLVVHVDHTVIVSRPHRELATPGPARGLVIGDGAWAGHPGGVVRFDLATGAELGRLAVPDLYAVKHVRRIAD